METASVEDLIFIPDTHGHGTGFSSKGSVVFTSVDTDPIWAVVFKCQHGRFAVRGSEQKHHDLWQSVNKGQSVRIAYRTCEGFWCTGRFTGAVGDAHRLPFVDRLPQI